MKSLPQPRQHPLAPLVRFITPLEGGQLHLQVLLPPVLAGWGATPPLRSPALRQDGPRGELPRDVAAALPDVVADGVEARLPQNIRRMRVFPAPVALFLWAHPGKDKVLPTMASQGLP